MEAGSLTRSVVDKIHIKDINLSCIIGTFEHERHEKQEIIVSVTLHADLHKAGITDDLKKTVDYKAVEQKIMGMVENSSRHLIEALAEDIAGVCLEFDMVEKVDVTVEKPGASMLARKIAAEISREKAY